jgi:hypothetical protein
MHKVKLLRTTFVWLFYSHCVYLAHLCPHHHPCLLWPSLLPLLCFHTIIPFHPFFSFLPLHFDPRIVAFGPLYYPPRSIHVPYSPSFPMCQFMLGLQFGDKCHLKVGVSPCEHLCNRPVALLWLGAIANWFPGLLSKCMACVDPKL